MSDQDYIGSRGLHGIAEPVEKMLMLLLPSAPRLMFGLRLAASVSLALFVTYYLQLQNSFWAATTAAIVCQPNLGASLQKGRFRAIGTIVGAFVMVGLLAMFAQDRNTLILSLALWCGLCGFAAIMLRNFASYAAALAGITATIIFADTMNDPTNAPFLAIIRVSEICIGIASAALVMLVTDFGTARRQLAGMLAHSAIQLSRGFQMTLAAESDTPATHAARCEVVRSLGLIETATDAAIGESSYLYSRAGNLRAALAALMDALVGWRNVGNHDDAASGSAVAIKREVSPILARIDATQIERDPRRFRDVCLEAASQIAAIRTFDFASCMIVDAARDVAASLARTADSILLLDGKDAARVPGPARRPIVADPLPAVLGGVRVFLAVLFTATFWVATAWPGGAFAVVFSAVATLIFGSFGDQASVLARDYTLGAALIAVIGGGLYFGVLPSLSGFPALAALLFLLFVPLGYMQAGKWHSVVFLAMSIASLPLLGLGNPITYDASGYFNLALAVITGSLAGTLFFTALPVVGPAVRARRLLALSLRDLRRLAVQPLRRAAPVDGAETLADIGTGVPTAANPAFFAPVSRPSELHHWNVLMGRRIEALSPQAVMEEAGNMMTILALGQAVIYLRRNVASDAGRRLLTEALHHLAAARLTAAGKAFTALSHAAAEAQHRSAETGPSRPVHVRAQVAVILDALDRHADLLSARATPWRVLFPAAA
ncbi:Uncharacterized membrane protein YccC [Pseudoxanthobacter soli DSM 19599]|uniref:Uncharacterized membrane protein YccC n=1 Tax=Pseudoxanthobacter soli DSM 19599 TaxID=1123029 RepID=A0A1M7Z9Q8_9HYPH|nr:FUSC family protein [Pseudoxanthobacter soli]SHO61625.1 Uncharacterized membrane protein YccC [Pseudoxanthobacter soli DSM 19599]